MNTLFKVLIVVLATIGGFMLGYDLFGLYAGIGFGVLGLYCALTVKRGEGDSELNEIAVDLAEILAD